MCAFGWPRSSTSHGRLTNFPLSLPRTSCWPRASNHPTLTQYMQLITYLGIFFIRAVTIMHPIPPAPSTLFPRYSLLSVPDQPFWKVPPFFYSFFYSSNSIFIGVYFKFKLVTLARFLFFLSFFRFSISHSFLFFSFPHFVILQFFSLSLNFGFRCIPI